MRKNINIKKLTESAKLPTKGSSGAGAWDIYANDIIINNAAGKATVLTGLSMEIPDGYMLCLVPRSSISKSKWILSNSFGVIDSDYRGEIMCKFSHIESYSRQSNLFPYSKGDRIAQIFLMPVIEIDWYEVDELSNTERGDGGFGSTGK